MSPNTNCSQHRLLPKAATTFDTCDGKHKDQSQNTFDWAGDDTQSKSVGMVLIPSLNVECQESYEGLIHISSCGFSELTGKQGQDCLPALSKVHGGREEEDAKGSVQCIDTVIEEFSERTTLLCATSEIGCQHLDSSLLYKYRHELTLDCRQLHQRSGTRTCRRHSYSIPRTGNLGPWLASSRA